MKWLLGDEVRLLAEASRHLRVTGASLLGRLEAAVERVPEVAKRRDAEWYRVLVTVAREIGYDSVAVHRSIEAGREKKEIVFYYPRRTDLPGRLVVDVSEVNI